MVLTVLKNCMKYNMYFQNAGSRWCKHGSQVLQTKNKSRVCLEELMSAACSCAIYSMFLRSLFPVSPEQTRHPGSCYPSDADTRSDLWGGSVCQWGRGIHRGAVSRPGRQQWFRTGWCHFDREQRGPCRCQRGARHSEPPPPSPSLSFNGLTSQFLPFLVHLSH